MCALMKFNWDSVLGESPSLLVLIFQEMVADMLWTVAGSVLIAFLSLSVFVALILWFRKYMQGTSYTKDTKIEGSVVIVTGANAGIGKETAIDLARRGGKVYIACRDIKRGEDALKEIMRKSGSNNVHFLQLDLASIDSIKEFSRKFHDLEPKLHILVNNAGVMACPKGFTKDGFEMHFGTNHLGHFLLTNLLLDRLKESAPSRVVNVASLMYIIGKIRKGDLFGEKFYFRWFAYASSKLANILFTKELARRLEGTAVTVNCLHPGVVNSELQRHVNIIVRVICEPFVWLLFKETLVGAQTQIRLAVDPDLDKTTGKYFSDCRETWTMSTANNMEMAKWLWERSEELTGLKV